VSVVAQQDIEYRRFSGYLDARHPQGTWFGVVTAVGDATGSLLALDLVFGRPTVLTLSSQIYSVESVAIRSSENVTRVARLFAVNMSGPSNLSLQHELSVTLGALALGADNALDAQDLAFLPLFLGSQRTAGTTASFSVILNNVNTISYRFEAEGYWWAARSVLPDGGPQRPPTGLYRA